MKGRYDPSRVVQRLSFSVDKVTLVSHWLGRWLLWFGVVAGIAMLIITFTDVVSYKLLSRPILGAFDLVRFTLLITMAFLGGITLINGRHLSVEIAVSKFPKRVQVAVEGVVSFLAFIVTVMVIWHSILYGWDLKTAGEISATTNIPLYPFVFIIAVGFVPIALVFFTKVIRAILSLRFVAK